MTKRLRDLKNVGKAALKDFEILGIHSLEDLKTQDPTHLFNELERKTKARHDPCVWDVFAAAIHEAQTGEATLWWSWTEKRKELQRLGKLKHLH